MTHKFTICAKNFNHFKKKETTVQIEIRDVDNRTNNTCMYAIRILIHAPMYCYFLGLYYHGIQRQNIKREKKYCRKKVRLCRARET